MRGPEIRKTHRYQPDTSTTWPTTPPCAQPCGMPKGARIHDVPEPDPEAAVIDARILGETPEERTEGDAP